jgi:RNA polymerase sigma factor (TIGR02999 family)
VSDVTRMLQSMESGDPKAAEELLPLVYSELRRLAAAKMANETPGQTLQPTALVHEAWMRLAGEQHEWQNRKHFFCVAAEAMRRILLDRARRRNRLKHGGQLLRVPIDEIDLAAQTGDYQLLQIDEALNRLAEEDPVKAELVKLRFFVGLRIPEAAEFLGISPTTAKRHWNYARAWLLEDLTGSD